jgi:hypothetical protein
MYNLATKNALHNILLVQIRSIAVLPSWLFGFGLTLWISFWIISRLPALSYTLVCHMHLGGRHEGGPEDDARDGAAASRRWREGEEKAGGGGVDGRKWGE